MIIATLTVLSFLFFGGGGLEHYLTDLKKPVKEAVVDKDRREAILDASKGLEKDLKGVKKEIQKQFDAYVEVHNSTDASPADFDAIMAELARQQEAYATTVLDARDKIHAQMTAVEWEAVFGKK